MIKETIQNSIFDTVTINDLKDRLFNGEKLSEDEIRAVEKFDTYRLDRLKSVTNEADFERIYLLIRAEANLADFKKFLD